MNVYVMVAFKVDKERSIAYKKCETLEQLAEEIKKAFAIKKADFISLRRIPTPPTEPA